MFHVEHLEIEFPEKFLEVKDFLVSNEKFELWHNKEYDLLKTIPVPSSEELNRYYESEEYISHSDKSNGLVSFLYQTVKRCSLKRKLKILENLKKKNKTLLDIGSGTGEFLLTAKNNGWETVGIEPIKKAREIAIEKNLKIFSDLNEVKNQKFDVITLWHVLEHIPNLDETIVTLSKLLTNKGTLIIAVPNFKSYDATIYSEFWAAYDVPRHIWHFSSTAIKKLFAPKFNFQKQLPLIFDSFYVSLLSEKYKTKKSFSLRAFWIGIKSNWKAQKTGEYSSLIYILEKKSV